MLVGRILRLYRFYLLLTVLALLVPKEEAANVHEQNNMEKYVSLSYLKTFNRLIRKRRNRRKLRTSRRSDGNNCRQNLSRL